MSKILIFKQPFPMGNHLLQEVLGRKLKEQGHDVYIIQQLNGQDSGYEYELQLQELNPDIVYFEMLDRKTFYLIESLFKNSLKILCFTSGGILNQPEDILDYHGIWYDKIMTNSIPFKAMFDRENIPSEFFPFYHSVIREDDLKIIPKYEHDVCFLGMGFGRLSNPDYKLERDLFFNTSNENVDWAIYGNGWGTYSSTIKGVLPPDDIGNLYHSSKSAVGIIAKGQRENGMINNRYIEMAMGLTHIISPNYQNFDWHGLAEFIDFVDSRQSFISSVKKIKNIFENESELYDIHITKQRNFVKSKSDLFYEKLNNLIDEI